MRARLGTSDLTILIGAGVATVALTVVAFLIAPVDAAPRVPGSSYSTEPDGARAAYLVLAELGHHVARSFEPIASLRGDPSHTTLILANPAERPSKGDQQALRTFIEHGGLVLAFGAAADEFLPGATVKSRYRQEGSVEVFEAALPGELTRGTREVSAYRGPRPSLDPEYVPVYGNLETPAVVTARFGDGAVVWCLDGTLIQNDGIKRGQNVNLIANAAGIPGGRRIAWDEYYHGQRRSFWSYIAATPLLWGLAQLGVIGLALIAGASRRRGPMRPRLAEPRVSPLEFIETMGSLYERAGNARAAVAATSERLRRRLATVAGVPEATPDDQLVAAAARRTGLDPDRTRAALTATAEALRRGIGDREAVTLAAELQELAAAADSARTSRAARAAKERSVEHR